MDMLPGGGWWEIFGEQYVTNPRYLVDDFYTELVNVWGSCRDGMGGGIRAYPDGKSLLKQPAILVDALAVIAAANGDIDKEEREQDQQR